ncbi:hypothetical protein M407DRAFT_242570 [Tulasnella calospora MUT 4182]|uniref:Uncharacterized protein n=1 Tax=Tulasnella calospora MUT 4182 TaxID=1051891 RepID=A0A0C3QNH2_9AGAM|nr:hypothetical protein M407DRAFT_242570 [Tulasnella calospora MUT 4182]
MAVVLSWPSLVALTQLCFVLVLGQLRPQRYFLDGSQALHRRCPPRSLRQVLL